MSSAYYALFHCLFILILAASCSLPPISAAESNSSNSNGNGVISNLRWASTGGGWRSQFACVGFANLFNQPHLDILTRFGAIRSWMSAQLFYSQGFYNRVTSISANSQALHDFVVEWMDSYNDMLIDSIDASKVTSEEEGIICNATDLGDMVNDKIHILSDLCHTLVHFDGDWAAFVEKMFVYVSSSFGDSDFANRIAGEDNRIEALKDVDLLIQSAIAANLRIRSNVAESTAVVDSVLESARESDDIAVYIGHDGMDTFYTTPLSAAYIVNASGTSYRYSTDPSYGDMSVSASKIPSEHSFSDWEHFHLYPAKNGTVHIDSIESDDVGTLYPAFGRGGSSSTTVTQVAAISSAAAGTFSPLASSTFSHMYSEQRYEYEQKSPSPRLRAFDNTVSRKYNQPMFDKFAVCSQWPNQCGTRDGMFVDGWIADNPAFVINVAQYQIAGGDMSKTLKVILTNTNQEWGTDVQYTQMLQYFDSPINEGVEPGSFLWSPGMWTPYQSPQVFGDSMNSSKLDNLIEPIPGSNMTTAILEGTTTDNPIFGIQAGQRVEILLINVNEPITTYTVTPDIVEFYTEPLAAMAVHIAENIILTNRIKAFVEPLLEPPTPSPPVPSSTVQSVMRSGNIFTLVASVLITVFLH